MCYLVDGYPCIDLTSAQTKTDKEIPIYFYSYKEMKPESNKKISMDSNLSVLRGAQHIFNKIYSSPTHKVVNFYLFIIIKNGHNIFEQAF